MKETGTKYRGLSPHKITPMLGVLLHGSRVSSGLKWTINRRDPVIANVLLLRQSSVRPNGLKSMPLPDFTDEEQYLISFAKSTKATHQSNSYMWGYLIGSAVLAGFGAYHGSVSMLLGAFGVVCGFRIYEGLFQAKWIPLWSSIHCKIRVCCATRR